MIKYYVIIVVLVALISCKSEHQQPVNSTVAYKGALKTIMHEGDISGKVELEDFEKSEHFYALGAAENLKGEIQILNSNVFNTTVVDSVLQFDNTYNKKATLLVYATINEWKSFKIPRDIKSYEQLENYIALTAKAYNINTDQPFPFLIEGQAHYVDWHVIDWEDGDMEHSHSKHKNSGLNGRLTNTSVDLLGFYSNAHHAVFTHHTTNMHIHVVATDKGVAGHVDGLNLKNGMILKLPKF